jgi:hypothetical protein
MAKENEKVVEGSKPYQHLNKVLEESKGQLSLEGAQLYSLSCIVEQLEIIIKRIPEIKS